MEAETMEYTTSRDVKQAMERAHDIRSQTLFAGVSWVFHFCKSTVGKAAGTGFFRWA
jgi:hypothetical protein